MISWAYLAGFLDGDGWITFTSNDNCSTRRFMVGFTQKSTEWRAMTAIHQFIQADGIRSTMSRRFVKSPLVPRRVRMINIHVREQASIVRLLARMIPHLLIKRKRAVECVTYLVDRLDKRGAGVPDKQQATNVYWTDSEILEMLRLHAGGHGNRSIASKLDRSINSVAHKLLRLRRVRAT